MVIGTVAETGRQGAAVVEVTETETTLSIPTSRVTTGTAGGGNHRATIDDATTGMIGTTIGIGDGLTMTTGLEIAGREAEVGRPFATGTGIGTAISVGKGALVTFGVAVVLSVPYPKEGVWRSLHSLLGTISCAKDRIAPARDT
jgi:hypothetical protein